MGTGSSIYQLSTFLSATVIWPDHNHKMLGKHVPYVLESAMMFSLAVLYRPMNISGCELQGRFGMSTLFKTGDIMIGGIFPIFNKQVHRTSTFEREPPEVKCVG